MAGFAISTRDATARTLAPGETGVVTTAGPPVATSGPAINSTSTGSDILTGAGATMAKDQRIAGLPINQVQRMATSSLPVPFR